MQGVIGSLVSSDLLASWLVVLVILFGHVSRGYALILIRIPCLSGKQPVELFVAGGLFLRLTAD